MNPELMSAITDYHAARAARVAASTPQWRGAPLVSTRAFAERRNVFRREMGKMLAGWLGFDEPLVLADASDPSFHNFVGRVHPGRLLAGEMIDNVVFFRPADAKGPIHPSNTVPVVSPCTTKDGGKWRDGLEVPYWKPVWTAKALPRAWALWPPEPSYALVSRDLF